MTTRPDGLVHMIRRCSVPERSSTRYLAVACGAPMPKQRIQDPAWGFTTWRDAVTCPDCIHRPVPWADTPDPAPKKAKA